MQHTIYSPSLANRIEGHIDAANRLRLLDINTSSNSDLLTTQRKSRKDDTSPYTRSIRGSARIRLLDHGRCMLCGDADKRLRQWWWSGFAILFTVFFSFGSGQFCYGGSIQENRCVEGLRGLTGGHVYGSKNVVPV